MKMTNTTHTITTETGTHELEILNFPHLSILLINGEHYGSYYNEDSALMTAHKIINRAPHPA
jgi:hypothetical protein